MCIHIYVYAYTYLKHAKNIDLLGKKQIQKRGVINKKAAMDRTHAAKDNGNAHKLCFYT